MRYSRPVRVIFGIIILVAFGWYMARWMTNSVMSNDVGIVTQSSSQVAVSDPDVAVTEDSTSTAVDNTDMTESVPADVPENNVVVEEEPPAPRPEELKAAELGLPTPPEVDVYGWELMLVNAKHPIDTYEPPQLAYLSMNGEDTNISYEYSDYRCPVDSRIAQPLIDFTQGCRQAGLPVYLSSGYRSYDNQNYLYERKIGQGYTPEVAATIVARPGTSEHQTGLVCDITDYYRELKDSSLEFTETYQWLKEHCAEYGFVVRYPADKSGSADSITGIIYEPWHFRYVGVEPATYMMENNLCLEEFLALYGVE